MRHRTRDSWATLMAALLLSLVTVACGDRPAPDADATATPPGDTPAATDDGGGTKPAEPAKPAAEGDHKPADGGGGAS